MSTTDSTLISLQRYLADSTGAVYIKDINLSGNQVTKDKIIYRELEMQPGVLLPKQDIDEFFKSERNKLINTDLFEEVNLSIEEEGKDSLNVHIAVKERWYTWPIPILELADRNFNEWWNNRGGDFSRLQYGIMFKRRNFRGRKESLDLLMRFGFSNVFRINYNIPFLDKQQKTSLSFGASYSETHTVAYATKFNKFVEVSNEENVLQKQWAGYVSVGKRIGFYDYHRVSLGYSSGAIADTVAELNPNYFLGGRKSQKFFKLSYSYAKDMRDIRVYPLNGYFVRGSFEKNGLGVFDDLNSIVIEGDYFKYTPISKRFFHELGATFKTSFPALQPYQEMRALGYTTKILRGYDNYVVEGQHLGIFKNTLRFKALSKKLNLKKIIPLKYFSSIPIEVYLKSYADAGYISSQVVTETNERLTNNLLLGWGTGVDVVTFYNTTFRLEYSLNKHDLSGAFYLYFKSTF
ncbi:BamA/TamA family outer membrane protein [Limibacter armeniacum]|uniref:POTRA domain-containing protein n=1 Tax=Limibacter armeniacum TaxID=466084 RepID=UPI002FE65CE4